MTQFDKVVHFRISSSAERLNMTVEGAYIHVQAMGAPDL